MKKLRNNYARPMAKIVSILLHHRSGVRVEQRWARLETLRVEQRWARLETLPQNKHGTLRQIDVDEKTEYTRLPRSSQQPWGGQTRPKK